MVVVVVFVVVNLPGVAGVVVVVVVVVVVAVVDNFPSDVVVVVGRSGICYSLDIWGLQTLSIMLLLGSWWVCSSWCYWFLYNIFDYNIIFFILIANYIIEIVFAQSTFAHLLVFILFHFNYY